MADALAARVEREKREAAGHGECLASNSRARCRVQELAADYGAALVAAGGGKPATPPSPATRQLVEDLCSGVRRSDRTGCMVIIRTPIEAGIKGARMLARQLRKARRAAGLDGTFAVIVDVDARVADSFNEAIDRDMPGSRMAMARWRDPAAKEPLRVTLHTDLADLPCILILCEKGKMGDSFPASFRYYDLRLRYTAQCGSRAALEQDLGRACRYQPASEYERRRYPLPTIMLSREAAKVVRLKPRAAPGTRSDVMLKLAPDARMRKLKSSGAGRHPALPDRPTDKDLSAHYRATWLPEFRAVDRKDRRHFDARAHEEYAGTRHAPAAGSKPWVDNGHHFLLQGLPQVGKTGAFLWLSWRLWREVAELAAGRGAAAEWPEDEVHASELQNDSEEELDEPGPVDACLTRKYPVFAEVRRINFKDAPRAGKYGDPSEDSPMYQFHTRILPQALAEVGDDGRPRHVYTRLCRKAMDGKCDRELVRDACKHGWHHACPYEGACDEPKCQLAHWEPRRVVATAAGATAGAGVAASGDSIPGPAIGASGPGTAAQGAGAAQSPGTPSAAAVHVRHMSHDAHHTCPWCEKWGGMGVGVDAATSSQLRYGVERDGDSDIEDGDGDAAMGSGGATGDAASRDEHGVTMMFPTEASRALWQEAVRTNCANLDCHFPIFIPSSRRARTGLLNLRHAFRDGGTLRKYLSVVVVKHREAEEYRRAWPRAILMRLPPSADTLGVGAARYWSLAAVKQHRLFTSMFVLDDSVAFWYGVTLAGDRHPLHGDVPHPGQAQKREVSLWRVMQYLQAADFDAERRKFALIGFHRMGRWMPQSYSKAAYRRTHSYSGVLINVGLVPECQPHYNPRVFCWEDIDFNRRLHNNTQVKPRRVLLKVYRFAMKKKLLKGGGAADQTFAGEVEPPGVDQQVDKGALMAVLGEGVEDALQGDSDAAQAGLRALAAADEGTQRALFVRFLSQLGSGGAGAGSGSGASRGIVIPSASAAGPPYRDPVLASRGSGSGSGSGSGGTHITGSKRRVRAHAHSEPDAARLNGRATKPRRQAAAADASDS